MESAARAILTRAGVPADPVPLTVARFMARQVADPERMCGPVPGDPMADLMTPKVSRDWRALQRDDGTPYAIFHDCDRPGLPVRSVDIRVLSATVLPTSMRPDYGGVGVKIDVDVGYLLRREDGVTPYVQSRAAFVYVEPAAPYRLSGPISLNWTSRPGLGANGVPDPAVFAPVGDRSAWESESAAAPAAGEASAAATVVQALARTLRSTSAELTFRREIGYAGEEPGRYETSGSVYPRAGAAESSGDRPELLAVRVLDRQRMFTQQVEPAGAGSTGTDGPTWTLYVTGTVPPDSTDRAEPLNIFTLLDWIGRLSAAVSTSCADPPSGQRCYLVTVPTRQALTPGAPGYRDAYLHAQDGNESLLLQVAVTDGRLAGIGLDYTFAHVAERSFRSRSSWEFSGYGEGPVPAELVAPSHYDEK